MQIISLQPMTLVVPAEATVVSHVRGAQLCAAQRVTVTLRREIHTRFHRDRSLYPTVVAFARAESRRLAHLGLTLSPGAIEVIIHRPPPRVQNQERLRQVLLQRNPRTRNQWYDIGDLGVALGWSLHKCRVELSRAYKRGMTVQRRPTAQRDKWERGWPFEYRVVRA